jgi:hypothetical protein
MMSWFSVNYVNGKDVLKNFACSEALQQAGDFVMDWFVNEMSKSKKYMGFKFDADENNPRKTRTIINLTKFDFLLPCDQIPRP